MSTDQRNSGVELPTQTSWALLRQAVVGRLAVIVQDRPDIFPVNHKVDHGSVLVHTPEGNRLSGAMGHKVAFEVDGYDIATATAWSVVVKGTANEVSRQSDALEAFDLPLFPWRASPKPVFGRIEPELITGRQFQVEGHAGSPTSPGPIRHAADE